MISERIEVTDEERAKASRGELFVGRIDPDSEAARYLRRGSVVEVSVNAAPPRVSEADRIAMVEPADGLQRLHPKVAVDRACWKARRRVAEQACRAALLYDGAVLGDPAGGIEGELYAKMIALAKAAIDELDIDARVRTEGGFQAWLDGNEALDQEGR